MGKWIPIRFLHRLLNIVIQNRNICSLHFKCLDFATTLFFLLLFLFFTKNVNRDVNIYEEMDEPAIFVMCNQILQLDVGSSYIQDTDFKRNVKMRSWKVCIISHTQTVLCFCCPYLQHLSEKWLLLLKSFKLFQVSLRNNYQNLKGFLEVRASSKHSKTY